MENEFKFFILATFTICGIFISSFTITNQRTIHVDIINANDLPDARIYVSVYSEKNFLKRSLHSKSLSVSNGKASANFELPEGEYAIATYQDLNQNEKLDRHFYGAPKEPYGFSNNVKPAFGPPSFKDCKFEVKENAKTITITLIK